MLRNVKQVIHVEADGRYTDTILVQVNANGSDFWECYVGVPKGDVFYADAPFINHRYKIWQVMEKKAFKDFGADESVQNRDAMPLDGAWLSFARLGIAYKFLDDNLFYYSAAFCYNNGFKNCTEGACYEAALTQADRMNRVIIENQNDEYRSGKYILKEEALEILKKSDYWDKKYITDFNDTGIISKTFLDLFPEDHIIRLYEFDQETQSNIFQICNFNLFMNTCGELFLKDVKKLNYTFPLFNEDEIIDFVYYIVRKGPVTLTQKFFIMNKLVDYMKPEHKAHKYWIKVMTNCSYKKLNKHDANNLRDLLKYLETKK